MRIGLTSIFVDDQDQAERFSTQVMPVRALADSGAARGARRGGAGAAPDRRAGAGVPTASRELGRPVLSLRNDDCRRDAERLQAKGWCSSRNPPGWPTAAWTRTSTTPAATSSTSTKTDKGAAVMQPTRRPTTAPHRPGSSRSAGSSLAQAGFAATAGRLSALPRVPDRTSGRRHCARSFTVTVRDGSPASNAPDDDADETQKTFHRVMRGGMKPSSTKRKS